MTQIAGQTYEELDAIRMALAGVYRTWLRMDGKNVLELTRVLNAAAALAARGMR